MLQFVVDYIEDAMPHTSELRLTGINTVLSADKRDTTVPTSIVFAKLIDLIRYMQDEDPYDLLFARNIRLKLPNSKVNPEIANTFKEEPAEFIFSNNGITMLCEAHSHDPGKQEVRIKNPRVCPTVTRDMIRVVINKLRKLGELRCEGAGAVAAAIWRKRGNSRSPPQARKTPAIPAQSREQYAFSEQLADDPPVARADCGTDCHLPAACFSARKKQTGNVGRIAPCRGALIIAGVPAE